MLIQNLPSTSFSTTVRTRLSRILGYGSRHSIQKLCQISSSHIQRLHFASSASTTENRTREHAEWASLKNGGKWELRAGWMARLTSASVVLSSTTDANSQQQPDNAILGTVVSKYSPPLSAEELLEEEEITEKASEDETTDPGEEMVESRKKPVASTPTLISHQSGLSLTVDFRQSAAAIGRIPSNYFRREVQHTEQDIAISRVIDRTLRPTIHPYFPGRTHIVCKPLALDEHGDSAILAINVAAAALAISPVPLQSTVAAARVGIVGGKIVVNPPREQLKHSSLNLTIAGTASVSAEEPQIDPANERVVMIEMEGREVDTEKFIECVHMGFEDIRETQSAIQRLVRAVGADKYSFPDTIDADSAELMERCGVCRGALEAIYTDYSHDKLSRGEAVDEVFEGWRLLMNRQATRYTDSALKAAFTELVKRVHRQLVLERGVRIDGRRFSEFRPIQCRADLYRKLHGSALFQRGQSQVLSTVTFDSPQAAFFPDAISQLLGAQRRKSFMLHYEFPQFATNELDQGEKGNRREIGHGLLAEKALQQIMPEEFPYTIRLACQVLESNGSTSMASVCAGSLALYDAGVPLLANHMAGLAMGLLVGREEKKITYNLLTDVNGFEDFAGDMDFKIAGTSKGFTAMQMDLKICGLPLSVLHDALNQAKNGLEHVLSIMRNAVAEPRSEFKPSVPQIELMQLALYKRPVLFRSGAYNAKLIEAETGVRITSEDDTNISLFAPNIEQMQKAKEMLAKMVEEQLDEHYQFGAVYKAQVVRILEGGVQVTLKEGARPIWIRNSDLSPTGRQNALALGLQVGSRINVQYFGRDQHSGQHRLSCKTLQVMDPPVQNLFGRGTQQQPQSATGDQKPTVGTEKGQSGSTS